MEVESVQSILQAAAVLHLDSLAASCCSMIADNLSPDNCLSVHHFAESHGFMELVQLSDAYAADNFQEVGKFIGVI